MQTKLGYFHQNIFKYAGADWEVPQRGFDIQNRQKHIYVELKNKHNTMNSASSQKTYMKMQAQILEDDMATCYLVEVISKKSRDDKWEISLDGKRHAHNQIRRMSMDKFYNLVFNDSLAFYKLCYTLPQIVQDVVNDNKELRLQNTVFDELSQQHNDILSALYLLAFKTYEGFNIAGK